MSSLSSTNPRQGRPFGQAVKDIFSGKFRPSSVVRDAGKANTSTNTPQLQLLDPFGKQNYRDYNFTEQRIRRSRTWYGKKISAQVKEFKVSLSPAPSPKDDKPPAEQLDFLDPFDKTNFRDYNISEHRVQNSRKWYGKKPHAQVEKFKVSLSPAPSSKVDAQPVSELDFLDPFDKTNFRDYQIKEQRVPLSSRTWYGQKRAPVEKVKVSLSPAPSSKADQPAQELDLLDPIDKTNFRDYIVNEQRVPPSRKWYGKKPHAQVEKFKVSLVPSRPSTIGDQPTLLEFLDPFNRQDYRRYNVTSCIQPRRRAWWGRKQPQHTERVKVSLAPAQTSNVEAPVRAEGQVSILADAGQSIELLSGWEPRGYPSPLATVEIGSDTDYDADSEYSTDSTYYTASEGVVSSHRRVSWDGCPPVV